MYNNGRGIFRLSNKANENPTIMLPDIAKKAILNVLTTVVQNLVSFKTHKKLSKPVKIGVEI